MTSQTPAYNLKAVLTETGLKADVLRAWERRYELPKPHRTPGGHRLYSEHDIETIKWLRSRQAEGLSISRAVELWKEIIEAGRDPLLEYLPARVPPVPDRFTAPDTRIEILRQNWLEANLAFDGIKAEEVLNQAFAIYPLETVCTEILQRGISDIGNLWHLGKASVQQEHFASALTSRRLESLITAAPRPTRDQTVLVGCPPGERHTFSALLLSLLLRRRGLAVVYLGADIPIERLEETAAAIKPDLIVLAAQQLMTAATLQSAVLALQGHGFPAAYGGLIFNQVPKLRQRIPAYYLGETLDGSIYQIELLISAPVPWSIPLNVDDTDPALGRLFRERRPLIEKAVLDEMQKYNLQTDYIGEANLFFGNGLSAALQLGDPAFIEDDLEWVKRLLTGRQIPAEAVMPYLAAYRDAIHKEIGKASLPIIDWLDSYLARTNG
jgi:methanogenic corrinoid protein MtbC1